MYLIGFSPAPFTMIQSKSLLSICLCAILSFFDLSASFAHPEGENEKAVEAMPDFYFDPADQQVPCDLLENPSYYDADLSVENETPWYAWLEFTPGKGDQIWVGHRVDGKWKTRTKIVAKFAQYAAPTLTVDSNGLWWLSYELLNDGQWDVMIVSLTNGKQTGEPIRVSTGKGSDINHRAKADKEGGVWIVWQSDANGQFDVVAKRFSHGKLGDMHVVGDHSQGDWHPSLAVTSGNRVCVVWDAYNSESFAVYMRTYQNETWSEVQTVTNTSAFQGRTDVAADDSGQVWITWEEGGPNWGKSFRGIRTTQIRDDSGPLHRFRLLRLAVLTRENSLRLLADGFPMPSVDQAENRKGRQPGVEQSGAFYERAKLAIDDAGRPWVVYRHYYTPWLGIAHRTHIEEGWGVFARYYGEDGWSKLYRMQIGQGDGMQRLEVESLGNGIAAIWTTGRTHRNRNQRPRGLVAATLQAGGVRNDRFDLKPIGEENKESSSSIATKNVSELSTASRVTSKKFQLFYGDLHRHTDLSLCRVPFDGTIDDAYRYAIEVAQLDFLGITDHSRDLARGDPLSQLWWRSRKEVSRHDLGADFIPYFAYERSHSNTADHNVISLRGDMLRPHTYPVPDFWAELDSDTITIPHQPIRRDTWNYQDDALRPLAEIYQGCRDNSIEEDIHRGLARGFHMGFIASSDHMSTSTSYACVWAPEPTRESIFRAMQARRTFGATDKIRLIAKAGQHWMGEIVETNRMPLLTFQANGTAPIERVQLIVDGKTQETISPDKLHVQLSRQLDLTGTHYVYFHLIQTDGNEAWSSPIWLKIDGDKTANVE